ncbi:MAG TPA: ATP-grasp domain-containing protein [Chromatiaceae bacterium]|jgi:hypothetical protein|nr:MAG: hypothetical protein N838_15505 [Thiohalocapsa sp. PB-PSB1]QQO54839.1 MAG: ATP-grasp domain-containing protein [Thiohalocapsa sp. PB-PSB1]HBG96402.1 ATP-grasp domain-containing protein [Chromatiaceae bacterium]HCS92044.1 ATP-grasp domain-containing protein [Chromatiaceae bacterium]
MRAKPFADASVRQIYNHDIMSCTAEGVTGNHLYSGRVLGATEPGDVIQIHPELRSQWSAIRAHYDRIGLSYTDEVIWTTEYQALADHPDHEVSVFFFGPDEHQARPDDAWFQIVDTINSKNSFMDMANRLGVPVPLTRPFAAVGDISENDIEAAPYPCYLKAAVSVSGVGIYRCGDPTELHQAIARFDPTTPVQIQQEVVAETFLNMQYANINDDLRRIAVTEQVLDGFVHQGNRYPARCEPWEVVEPMAAWMHQEGMRGVFAFDVAVVDDGVETKYLAIECNPRFNGATYPTAVAQKLGIAQWLAIALHTQHQSLDGIDLSGIEYNPDTGQGVVLVNWGPILVGKILVLIAGDLESQQRLVEILEQRL